MKITTRIWQRQVNSQLSQATLPAPMSGRVGRGAVFAALLALAIVPGLSLAQHDHAPGERGGMQGQMRGGGHGEMRGGGHADMRGGMPGGMRGDMPGAGHGDMRGNVHGGMPGAVAPRRYAGSYYAGAHSGSWGGHQRLNVPRHWVGMHPHFGGGYVRPWGRTWVPHHWVGGYWGGVFWPSVTLGWDFPWFFATLPIGYSTYWYGAVPYYYWQGVYYVWSPDYDNYVVTDPPPVTGDVQGDAPPDAGPPPDESGATSAFNLYVYPMRGQDAQQTADDKYQCHEWAVNQTGFDPIDPSGSSQAPNATPADYRRAMTACLDARGYSVR